MKKLTMSSIVLITSMLLGIQAVMAADSLDDQDMIFAFGTENNVNTMVLSEQEMVETEGALWWTVGFGAVGGAVNSIGYIANTDDWSFGEAAYRFGTGFSGGFVAALPGSKAYQVGRAAVGGTMMQTPIGGW